MIVVPNETLFMCALLFFVVFGWAISAIDRKNNLKTIVKAMQDTGIRGELFSVTLPDDKVAIAGVVMGIEEAQRFFYEYRDGHQVILERVDDQTIEVFRRKPRT